MANKIQFRRGNQADLPTLDAGEPAWTTDTERFYIGNPLGSGNILISAGAGGVVGKVGTPVAGQVAFWSNANDITGATGFVWNDTLKKLGIDNVELPVSGRVYLGPSTNATYVAADAAAQVSMTVASQVVMWWFDTSVTLLAPERVLEPSELAPVLDVVKRYRGVEDTHARAAQHAQRAADAIAPFPDGPVKQALAAAAWYALERDS